MESKTQFNKSSLIIIVIILILLVLAITAKKYYSDNNSANAQNLLTKCAEGEKKQCISSEGYQGHNTCDNGFYSQTCYVASLDDCKVTESQLSVLCCKDKAGSIYNCNEKTDFNPGDYVIIKTNLKEALKQSNLNFESYKACSFSKLLTTGSDVPDHYEPGTSFSSQEVGCSKTFSAADFHQAAVAGFIPKQTGKLLLADVRVYPSNILLQTGQDALNNVDASTSVFKLEVNIVE